MANVAIPNLQVAVSLTGSEQLEAVQAGVSCRITTSQIKTYVLTPAGNYTDDTAAAAAGAADGSHEATCARPPPCKRQERVGSVPATNTSV